MQPLHNRHLRYDTLLVETDENAVLKQHAVDMDRELRCESIQSQQHERFYDEEMTDKTPALGTHLALLISIEPTLKHRARHPL